MRFTLLSSTLFAAAILFVGCGSTNTKVENPDPNHTHGDFAVWIDGKQLDFSSERFMSGTSDEAHPDHRKHHMYLHLHDGNGHVIHRHKPGLGLREFLTSIGVKIRTRANGSICITFPQVGTEDCEGPERWYHISLNGSHDTIFLNDDYVFNDTDKILITPSIPGETSEEFQARLASYWEQMTDDACLYSRTCPERGEPPIESCISDPTIPCK